MLPLAGKPDPERETHEEFLARYGKASLIPGALRRRAAELGEFARKKTGQVAKAGLTVAGVAGVAGKRSAEKIAAKLRQKATVDEQTLIRALFISPARMAVLRADVSTLVQEASARFPDESADTHASVACAGLVSASRVRSGALGGLTAIPGSLPWIGSTGTLVLTASSDMFYLLRTQFLLCHGIAMAYEADLSGERMQAVALSLMGIPAGEVSGDRMNRRLTDLIDRTADTYMKLGLKKAFTLFLEKISTKASGGLLRVIPFVGVPFGILSNVNSISVCGEKAEAYFKFHRNQDQRGKR
ncbi:MAG: hypothetical protein MI863_21490 [Desulfobacterales bacterium]|nr:hypothetical protein [Desulfobacterales bacterium]